MTLSARTWNHFQRLIYFLPPSAVVTFKLPVDNKVAIVGHNRALQSNTRCSPTTSLQREANNARINYVVLYLVQTAHFMLC